ncbi:MAG: type IV toxin-antitoxin system AbiEi family antitoxin domain-containing protein [Venatoribacter sp.]
METTELFPYGYFVTRQYLLKQGLERYQLDNALKQNKVYALARGVFARPDVPIEWQGLAASLRKALDIPVYVGGLSALVEHGLAHYISFQPVVNLYSCTTKPSWFDKLDLDIAREWYSTARIWDMEKLVAAKSLQEQTMHDENWLLASPEQAYIELLTQVPNTISFEQVDNIMQGLTSLSPKRLDALLHACKHVLAKRLFFFFAERYQYPWFKKLNLSDYDLGAGKRMVAEAGKLNPTYNITVPQEFYG